MKKSSCHFILIAAFVLSALAPVSPASALPLLNLPEPGAMVGLSTPYQPALVQGLTIHKNNPFLIDFLIDKGQDDLTGARLQAEGERLVRYFFASLAIPEQDLWVNLSPYEQGRIVPSHLGQTEMGRDLLAQDYLLKQTTASLLYPEAGLGRKFWDAVYARVPQGTGLPSAAVNTLNKVWIVPDRAQIFERGQAVFVTECHLKVMLEEDYLAMSRSRAGAAGAVRREEAPAVSNAASKAMREALLPVLEQEVNTGRNFARLRQICHSLILASWYKKRLASSLLGRAYADRGTVQGIDVAEKGINPKIYQRYVQAYRKGVFNYIQEDPQSNGLPRKYFSGGFIGAIPRLDRTGDAAKVARNLGGRSLVDFAMSADVEEAMPQEREVSSAPAPGVNLGRLRDIEAKLPEEDRSNFFMTFLQAPIENAAGSPEIVFSAESSGDGVRKAVGRAVTLVLKAWPVLEKVPGTIARGQWRLRTAVRLQDEQGFLAQVQQFLKEALSPKPKYPAPRVFRPAVALMDMVGMQRFLPDFGTNYRARVIFRQMLESPRIVPVSSARLRVVEFSFPTGAGISTETVRDFQQLLNAYWPDFDTQVITAGRLTVTISVPVERQAEVTESIRLSAVKYMSRTFTDRERIGRRSREQRAGNGQPSPVEGALNLNQVEQEFGKDGVYLARWLVAMSLIPPVPVGQRAKWLAHMLNVPEAEQKEFQNIISSGFRVLRSARSATSLDSKQKSTIRDLLELAEKYMAETPAPETAVGNQGSLKMRLALLSIHIWLESLNASGGGGRSSRKQSEAIHRIMTLLGRYLSEQATQQITIRGEPYLRTDVLSVLIAILANEVNARVPLDGAVMPIAKGLQQLGLQRAQKYVLTVRNGVSEEKFFVMVDLNARMQLKGLLALVLSGRPSLDSAMAAGAGMDRAAVLQNVTLDELRGQLGPNGRYVERWLRAVPLAMGDYPVYPNAIGKWFATLLNVPAGELVDFQTKVLRPMRSLSNNSRQPKARNYREDHILQLMQLSEKYLPGIENQRIRIAEQSLLKRDIFDVLVPLLQSPPGEDFVMLNAQLAPAAEALRNYGTRTLIPYTLSVQYRDREIGVRIQPQDRKGLANTLKRLMMGDPDLDRAMATADEMPVSAAGDRLSPNPTGGIDLNTAPTAWQERREGPGVHMDLAPDLLERITRYGIRRLVPRTRSITPVSNISALIGPATAAE